MEGLSEEATLFLSAPAGGRVWDRWAGGMVSRGDGKEGKPEQVTAEAAEGASQCRGAKCVLQIQNDGILRTYPRASYRPAAAGVAVTWATQTPRGGRPGRFHRSTVRRKRPRTAKVPKLTFLLNVCSRTINNSQIIESPNGLSLSIYILEIYIYVCMFIYIRSIY